MKKGKIKTWMIILSILTILITPLKIKALSWTYDYNPPIMYYQINNGGWIGITKNTRTLEGIDYNYIEPQRVDITGILMEYSLPNDRDGVLSFSVRYTGELNNPPTITGNNTGAQFTCYPAGVPTYNGENTYNINYFCPNYRHGTGYNNMIAQINAPSGKTLYNFAISRVMIIQESESSEITNSINNQTTELHTQWQQDANNWDDFKNSDINNQTKEQPNQDQYNDVQSKEQSVYDNLDDIDIDTLIDMNVDLDTNNWIWNTITSLLNTNARVFSMVISILSLGLCKFILGR